MLNKIIIMGRLTRDPELRRTGSGTAVTSFSLAVDRDFKSQSGEKETDFIDVVAWRSTAEFVSRYFTKGRMVVVEGRLQIREWTDKDGGKLGARRSLPTTSTSGIPSGRVPVDLVGLPPMIHRGTCNPILLRLAKRTALFHFKGGGPHAEQDYKRKHFYQ